MNRRGALKTIGAGIAGLVVGGGIGYLASSSQAPRTVTSTQFSTVTSTQTQTVASTVSTTATKTITSTTATGGGPGVDYFYDKSLSGTTVNWLAAALPEKPPVFKFIPLFEQETGIKVNITTLSETDVFTKAATVFAAQSPQYDIVDAGWFGAAAYAWWKQGWVTPIAKFLGQTPSGWNAKDLLPSVTAACSTFPEDGGDLLVLPIVDANCQGTWYQMDAFQKVGAPVPFPGTCNQGSYVDANPITWDEFTKWADKVHSPPKMIGYGCWSAAPILDTYAWEPFVWSMNKNYIHKDFTPNFTDPDVVAATQQYATIVKRYISDPVSWDWGAQTADETAGKLAAWMTCNVDYSDIFAQGSQVNPDNTRFAWFPANVTSPQMQAGSTPVLSAFSKNQQAAWSFYSWLKSPRMEQLFFLEGNGPTRQSLLTNPANLGLQNWAVQDVLQPTAWLAKASIIGTKGAKNVYCNIVPKMPRSVDLHTKIGTNLARVLAGELSAQDAMADVQSFATTLFQDIGFYGKKTYDFGT